jgi:hypothetical protein
MTSRPAPTPAKRARGGRRGRGLGRLRTVGALIAHFMHRQRFFLAPLLAVLLVAAVLLILTGGLSYVAPFVYAIF